MTLWACYTLLRMGDDCTCLQGGAENVNSDLKAICSMADDQKAEYQ